jgi:hypothetical protein
MEEEAVEAEVVVISHLVLELVAVVDLAMVQQEVQQVKHQVVLVLQTLEAEVEELVITKHLAEVVQELL